MFEPTPSGLRFVDLGSRNGSWVNLQKVKEADLKPGDTVRMGSILITFAQDAPPPPPIPRKPAAPARSDPEDDGSATMTVSPKAEPKPEAVAADEEGTVLLSREAARTPPHSTAIAAPSKAAAPKPELPPKKSVADDAEGTVLLSREAVKPLPHTGTMLFRPEEAPKSMATDTARILASPKPSAPPAAASHAGAPGEVAEEAPVDDMPPKGSWTGRHALVILGAALTVYVVLAFPLVRTLGNALREESLRRGRALLDLLTASNAAAVAEGRARDLQVEMVTREERVKEAIILDLNGKVLAPSTRVDETFETIEGIEPSLEEIRTFYLGRRRNGDYVLVEPILDRGRRAGIALLVYEVASASGSWAVAVLLLGILVLMLAVLVAVVMGKRFTLEPIAGLRDDVEAVVKGDAKRVPLAQGFAELSEVAKSVNRLIERASALAPAARPSPPLRPAVETPARTPRVTPTAASIGRETPIPEPPAAAPPPSGSRAAGDGAFLWVDAGFLVIRAEPGAAQLLGATPDALEGRHVIEAIKEEKVLGAVLDALNALDDAPGTVATADAAAGPLSISAVREGDRVAVSLKLGA
jgi:HAMP domain-containing protein